MKRIIVLTLILQLITTSALAQATPNRYEVEYVTNPNPGKKDTRQVNAVMVFEQDGIKIQSRRSNETFKEFKYSDVKSAEHSYSKPFRLSKGTAIALSVLSGMPFFLMRKKDMHWLMIATAEDYAVLKIENDNYRLIRMELIVKEVGVLDIDENK